MDEKEYQEQNKKYEKQIYFVKSIILMSFLGAVIFSFPILRAKEISFCLNCEPLSIDTLSKLGDYISGPIATILNFIGLLLIYLSFLGQRQDILMQQYELKETQKTLKEQQKELAEQNKNTQRVRFENTFFHLVKMIYDLQNTYVRGDRSGAEVFKKSITDLINTYHSQKKNINSLTNVLKDSEFYYSFQNYISHISNILEFVEVSNLEKEEKKFYIKTLRSLLSVRELLFIEIASQSILFNDNKSDLFSFLISENQKHFNNWK
jgi:hypothetical protein